MMKIYLFLISIAFISCEDLSTVVQNEKIGKYTGIFTHKNFSDQITIEIEKDSTEWKVYFSSLEQNANRIPLQDVNVKGDSINFKLQSDYFTYYFKNKWINENNKLESSLSVDTVTVAYTLEKEFKQSKNMVQSEDISFESNGIVLNGTIWSPNKISDKGLVIVTSSGNADRSSSRAEAILFAQRGYTTFHYDKRGTGITGGDWESATIEELAADDINAIKFFSAKSGILLSNIGIKGSSQGATKVPYILNKLKEIKYGIAVSCPGVTLLESDLNYWKNTNSAEIGPDIEDAMELQRKVYEYIAGIFPRTELEILLESKKSKSWFVHVWIPNLNEIKTDKKLLFSPIPYFEKVFQPILLIQGGADEIIPENSIEIIVNALVKAKNTNYETVRLESASHSMYNIGKSDFPYWSKLHSAYIKNIEDWIEIVTVSE